MLRFDRVFLLDPGLGPFPGHWATLARNLKRAFQDLGLEVVLCGHKRQDRAFLKDLAVEPLFEFTPYEPYSATPHDRAAARASFATQKKRFADDLETLPELGQQDLLVFPTIYPQILGGVVEWASRDCARREQGAAILLQFSEEVNVYNKARGNDGDTYYFDYYREVMPAGLGRDTHPKWRFFAASPGLGDLFSVLLGKDVLPLPMPGSAVAPAACERGGVGVKVGVLGHTSIDKGGFLLADLIYPTLERFPDVAFNLHLNTNPDTRALDAQFTASERLRIVRGYISDAEIQAVIDGSDIVVLPYRPEKYRLMPSAIFVQAASAGKVAVLPANSHMHREALLRGGGIALFREHTADAIRAALWHAIAGIDELSAKAAAAAPAHRSFNNARAYATRILEAFG